MHPPAQLTLTADDTNTAYPINNNINVFGGTNVHTTSTDPNGNVLTVSLVDHPTLVGGLTISSMANAGVVMSDANGLLASTVGTDRQIIVSRAAGPVWANLKSNDGSITISNDGNDINLASIGGGGGGGMVGVVADYGLLLDPTDRTVIPRVLPATPVGTISISGSDVIYTEKIDANTLLVDLQDSYHAGDLILGGGVGVQSTWGTIYSSNGSVNVVYEPVGTSPGVLFPRINVTSTGGAGGFGGLKDDAGNIASPDLVHTVQIAGDGLITTTALLSKITASLHYPSDDGKILISSSTGAPSWANIVGAGGITVTNGHNTITLTGGGGGGGGFVLFNLDNNHVNTNASNVLTITGGATVGNLHTGANQYNNITTIGDGANLMKIATTSSIFIPATTSNMSAGVIGIGTTPFIHAYGTNNTFIGSTAGTFSLTTASAHDNTGLGFNCLGALTTGAANVAAGSQSLNSCTTGSNNSAYGVNSLQTQSTASNNTGIGYHAGYALTGSDNTILGSVAMDSASTSSNCTAVGYGSLGSLTTGGSHIALGYGSGGSVTTGSSDILIGNVGTATLSNSIKIGTQGSGAGQQNTCYIAGIVGNGVSNPMPVFINSATGQLGVGADGGAGSDAFMYIQQTNVPNAFPTAGTIYFLGSTVELTKLFDRGETQFAGVNFTATKAGIWFFNMSVSLNNMSSADWASCSLEAVQIIIHDVTTPANSLTYAIANIPNPGYGGWEPNADQLTLQFSTMCPMSVGATAQFCVSVNPDFTSPASIGLGPVIAQNPATANATFVSGYFVSA